jgi:kumamolisin
VSDIWRVLTYYNEESLGGFSMTTKAKKAVKKSVKKTTVKAAAKGFATQAKVAIEGSERTPFGGVSAKIAKVSGSMSVSLVMKPKAELKLKKGVPAERMSRAAFAKSYGADPASLKLVKAFAKEYGLTVTNGPGPCIVQVKGTAASMQNAFGVTLSQVTTDQGTFRVREGLVYVPQGLDGHVLAVLGLDNRPQAKPHFRLANKKATNTSFTPVQIGQLYGFPAGAKATGQTIGLIELGGGYRAADITAYFKTLSQTAPTVVAVPVDGGKNAPSTASGADGEVMLDIEVSAAVAPGAKLAVYFAPNTDQGFIDAITTAVHDRTNKPSVISISWGGPESSWTSQSIQSLNAACQAAAALGVTITVAAGDDGSTDGGTGNNVDFPASSPNVLACGGTKIAGSGTTITSEVVWNELAANEGATGGGVSNVFPLPTWQANAGVPAPTVPGGGRGVPDVAGDADPTSGYVVRVDGSTTVIGGTSAVAPLWAGLIALANAQSKTSVGFVNPALYAASAKKAFRDITSGNNGAFTAGPGWDACTGLGSPIGSAVIAVLLASVAPAKKTKSKA